VPSTPGTLPGPTHRSSRRRVARGRDSRIGLDSSWFSGAERGRESRRWVQAATSNRPPPGGNRG
jgi:hypothetical protein